MRAWRRPTTFVNARVVTPSGEACSVRFGEEVLAIDAPPASGDRVIDLDGRIVLPGLVNAHDHLELNHYGPLRPRERYGNAREWIDHLRPIIQSDPEIRRRSRVPLADRLLFGGVKNVLAGVTTVAHHNPLYREFGRRFPVRLVERMGWAHSLGLENGPAGANGEVGGDVAARSHMTPPDRPFIVHAAEGTDACAAAEVRQLDARNALRDNTVLVHGLAVPPEEWHRLFDRGVSLCWCAASNRFLFGRTLDIDAVLQSPRWAGHVAAGTDSRLTGARDLLDELRIGADAGARATDLLGMVTTGAASVLRLRDAGRVEVGSAADFCILPASSDGPAEALLRADRAGLSAVLVGGRPTVAEPALDAIFQARGCEGVPATLDGSPRLIESSLLARIERSSLREDGLAW